MLIVFSVKTHAPTSCTFIGMGVDCVAAIGVTAYCAPPGCTFVLFVGTKKLAKRQEFEAFISKKLVI